MRFQCITVHRSSSSSAAGDVWDAECQVRVDSRDTYSPPDSTYQYPVLFLRCRYSASAARSRPRLSDYCAVVSGHAAVVPLVRLG